MSYLRKALSGAAVFLFVFCAFASLSYAEGTKTGTVNCNSLNVRSSPSATAGVTTQLSKGTQLTISSSSNGWYKIIANNVTGWVVAEFVTVKDASANNSGVITGDDVNLRSSASTSAKVVKKLDEGEKVSVLSRSGEWYKVKTSGGAEGWVYKSFIQVKNSNVSRNSDEAAAAKPNTTKPAIDDSSSEESIVSYAKKFLGVKYVYGGSSPSGFDCSGFTQYVYKHFGITIERVAADQAKQGTAVKQADLQPGDLVFFDTNGGKNYINHVGIYIGNGAFIHASSGRSSHRVVISSLNESFYSNAYISAKHFTK